MTEGFEQEHSFWFNESLEEEMSLSTPPLLYFHQNQVTFMCSHHPYRPYHDHDYRRLPMHVVIIHIVIKVALLDLYKI